MIVERKLVSLLFVLITLLLCAVAGGAAVAQVQEEYFGVCSTLSGFPGLLQRAGMLQAGTCKGKPGGSVCDAGAACTVNNKGGRCKNTAKPGGSPVCTCVVAVSP